MLHTIGKASIQDLFRDIKGSLRHDIDESLPEGMHERDVFRHLKNISAQNILPRTSFAGGGMYHHFIPATVDAVISRSEFFTSYTPYQPEVSQGNLQAIYEYQTMICRLLGMEVSNASLYDGATAVAESLLMSVHITGKREVCIAENLNPEYLAVCKTYCEAVDISINIIPTKNGSVDIKALQGMLSEHTAGVIVQSPNFFGIIEDLDTVRKCVRTSPAMFIVAFSEALAWGLLEPPGSFDADIAAGEGQSLGIPVQFGGPGLGIMACKQKYMRKMPGRICGATVDTQGNRGFVLTLQAREQHIRRESANSNICSNHALCALAASVYMATLGTQGMLDAAHQSMLLAHHAHEQLCGVRGIEPLYAHDFFNEFVIKVPDIRGKYTRLAGEGIVPGILLEEMYPNMKDCLLVSCTEMNTGQDILELAKGLS
ncbi:MAG: aminomethyl-transferring glycine dehydrogenase subunit GcvPA [Spirochaetales bacterium]|nr:aminomethyl-transferring glycine dehydrogenase subunit GcvPA [Spirochaetales bacterium]